VSAGELSIVAVPDEGGLVVSVVIGCDPHKRTHTAVAIDAATGERISERTVDATDAGHLELVVWGRGLSEERRWAVEDCRHVSGRLQRSLLGAGESVLAVPPKMMAGTRRSARERGKSDPIDARAVALAALREPDLPPVHVDGRAREVKVLLDHREDLIGERTRVQQRLRWHLVDLGIEGEVPARALDQRLVLDRTGRRLAAMEQTVVVQVARDLVRRCRHLTREITAIEPRLAKLVAAYRPELVAIPGCGPLTAAKIVAEVAGVDRFSSEAKLAMHAGVAPIPCSSGSTLRHRLNRSGNRQLNLALHRIAITQARVYEPAQEYLSKKQAAGMSRREAIRSLKRLLVRRIYNVMKQPVLTEGLT
jgi:transposase